MAWKLQRREDAGEQNRMPNSQSHYPINLNTWQFSAAGQLVGFESIPKTRQGLRVFGSHNQHHVQASTWCHRGIRVDTLVVQLLRRASPSGWAHRKARFRSQVLYSKSRLKIDESRSSERFSAHLRARSDTHPTTSTGISLRLQDVKSWQSQQIASRPCH